MHVTIAILYSLTVWVSLVAYAAITGTISIGYLILSFPFVISGSCFALWALDFALNKVRKLWA